MAKVRKVRRDPEVYAELVARREHDGLTWREAAGIGGVPLATLMEWARRLRGGKHRGVRARRHAFVELRPSPEVAPVDRIELVLRTGRRLLVPLGPPAEGLLDLILLLERTC